MRFYTTILTLFLFFGAYAQEEVVAKKPVVDSLYREDQFYLNITYNNNLQNAPKGLRQSKFSPGFSFGVLRDMPVNKSRTFAFAAGLGYSINVYNENLYQYQTPDSGTNYEIISSDIYYTKNKIVLQYLELPLEIRWRASTPESHKFWRVYTGFKLSYLIADKYKFVNDVENVTQKNNPDLNKIQYGCYIAAGWNTWNFYAYYGLNSLYKSLSINNEPVKLNALNIGLQFYIL